MEEAGVGAVAWVGARVLVVAGVGTEEGEGTEIVSGVGDEAGAEAVARQGGVPCTPI